VITSLSVSQATTFDPDQPGGCPRRWWLESVHGLKQERGPAQDDGDAGHALFAPYFRTGAMPGKRVKMGKAVTGAILKGELPKPGPDLLVEWRFDGQPQRDAEGNWVPLDVERTVVRIGGVPWDGFIDLAFRRETVPEVWDHKFSSDIHENARASADLIKTVQLPVYVYALAARWPDAERWRIAHHNVSRKGVDSFIRGAVVHVDQVFERIGQIETLVPQMQAASDATAQDDVPFNRKSCSAWQGCPHQSICSAFKEKRVQLTPEEMAIFAGLDATPTPAPVAELPPPTPAPTPLIMPPCAACGEDLNPDNASRLQSGAYKHIGCSANAPKPVDCPPLPHLVEALGQVKAELAPVDPVPMAGATPTGTLTAGHLPPVAEQPKRSPGRPRKLADVPQPVPEVRNVVQEAKIAEAVRDAVAAAPIPDSKLQEAARAAQTLLAEYAPAGIHVPSEITVRVRVELEPVLAKLLERLLG
jgi:hypothetical protein